MCLARWKGLIPSYLAWQREREASGWSWSDGEVDRSIEITTPGGYEAARTIGPGRCRPRRCRRDRLQGEGAKTLKDSLEAPGEDVQLAVYALLWGDAVTEAMFLSVDRKNVEQVALEQEVRELAQGTSDRLAAMFDPARRGCEPARAGRRPPREHCDARGLCRKDHWHD